LISIVILKLEQKTKKEKRTPSKQKTKKEKDLKTSSKGLTESMKKGKEIKTNILKYEKEK